MHSKSTFIIIVATLIVLRIIGRTLIRLNEIDKIQWSEFKVSQLNFSTIWYYLIVAYLLGFIVSIVSIWSYAKFYGVPYEISWPFILIYLKTSLVLMPVILLFIFILRVTYKSNPLFAPSLITLIIMISILGGSYVLGGYLLKTVGAGGGEKKVFIIQNNQIVGEVLNTGKSKFYSEPKKIRIIQEVTSSSGIR